MPKPVRLDANRLTGDLSRRSAIKRLLEATGWEQQVFAEHIDVRDATVSDWMRGKISIPKVVALYCQLMVRMVNSRHGEEDGT